MANNSSTILVRILGDTKGLSKSLAKAQSSLGGLERISGAITGGMKTAGIAAAVFGAAAVGAAAVGAAALAAVPAALAGIGIAFAAQNKQVKTAFTDLKSHVVGTMKNISEPLVQPLVRGAGQIQRAFDVVAPSLERIFVKVGPLLDDAFAGLIPIARQIGPMLEQAFAAGEPVLRAFGRGVGTVVKGLGGMFQELGKGSGPLSKFVDAFFAGVSALLPALGRLIVALAPVGTTILQTVIPALVSLLDWISARVGPAFEAFTGFLSKHSGAAKAVGLALVGIVAALKVMQIAMALATVATQAYAAVAFVIRAAIIVWRNAQLALNLAMMLNPIGLVVIAIIALVAIFVIAWQKSETFRNIVIGAWNAIKTAAIAVFNFLKGFIVAVWGAIKTVITSYVRIYVAVIRAAWNAIKAVTSAVWNGIRAVVSAVIRAVASVIRTQINVAKTVVSAAWNFIKGATTRIWNGIKNAVRTAVAGLMTIVRGIKGKVTGAFSGAAGWLLGAGKDLIRGMINGVKNMAGGLVDAAKSVVGNAIKGAKALLGINSPSKVFRKIGEQTGQGLVIGMERMAGKAKTSAAGLSRAVADGFEAPRLSLTARPAFADGAGGAGRINVTVTLTSEQVSQLQRGRQVRADLDAWDSVGGRRRG